MPVAAGGVRHDPQVARIHLPERADGGTTLAYRRPSALLAPFGDPEIDAIAAELDAVFAAIARRAMAD